MKVNHPVPIKDLWRIMGPAWDYISESDRRKVEQKYAELLSRFGLSRN